MPIQHPEFCDPRLCTVDPGTSAEHFAAPLTWKPNGDDTELSIGITRYDCLDGDREVGPVKMVLTVTSIRGTTDTALTAADARAHAAEMVRYAERVDALNRRGAR